MNEKKKLIDIPGEISINNQCDLLGLSKGSLYYNPEASFTKNELEILNRMDEIYTDCPFYGYRKIHQELIREGFAIGKDKVLRFMQVLGIEALCPGAKKYTSVPDKNHKVYPYLLNDIEINSPNQVWAIDITYIRMTGGFIYLVAIIDWYSKFLLSYRLSNSLELYFCKEALNEALDIYEKPDIFNSDQGSQFTSFDFTKILLEKEIAISMDSKGRAIDNRIIERFFRTIKYENIYPYEYSSLLQVKKGIGEYIQFYNYRRLHQTLDYLTPAEVYFGNF